MTGQERIPKEDIRAALEEALEDEDPPTLFDRVMDWLGETLDLPAVDVPWGRFLAWILLGSLVVFLVWFFVVLAQTARLRRREAEEEQLVSGIPLEERLRSLRAEAAAAKAAGDLRLALRTNLFALVVGLGRRGDLVYRDAWTQRELLARGRPSRAVRELLEPLVRELEPKEFGSGEVLLGDVERLERLVEEHLGELRENVA